VRSPIRLGLTLLILLPVALAAQLEPPSTGGYAALDQRMRMLAHDKRVLMIFLNGGMSQFESWDPKPGQATGGPFQSIQTSVPGYHVSPAILLPLLGAILALLGLEASALWRSVK
jgi:hypothetical protein